MGALYLVSTPIGNLEDITLRALKVLREVAVIAAEDTRHSTRLLKRYEITVPMLSYHEHNEHVRIPAILSILDTNRAVALISDAGTPLISDPGLKLVQAACKAGHRVVPIPGASAILTALTASGLPSDRFLFLGFPPRKRKARQKLLKNLAVEPGTLVFYESPRRLHTLLEDTIGCLGPARPLVVARELTKLHETIWRGRAGEAVRAFAETPLGEVVVLVGGAVEDSTPVLDQNVVRALEGLLAGGMSASESVRLLAKISGASRQELYRLAIQSETVGEP
jgi:16S rRNA (cytidine1402-2'-O)-methyltransferase